MAEFYTNLPPKDKDNLDKTIEKLTTTQYQTEYEFNVGEYDAAVGFFVSVVSRGPRQSRLHT